MSESTAQVRITNTFTSDKGVNVEQVLSIKHSALLPYLNSLVAESNKKYTPNRAEKFRYLPLLSVWDLADTQEEYFFSEDDLPRETLFNSKGIPILIIIPEEAGTDIGVNKFEYLSDKKNAEMIAHLQTKHRPSSDNKAE